MITEELKRIRHFLLVVAVLSVVNLFLLYPSLALAATPSNSTCYGDYLNISESITYNGTETLTQEVLYCQNGCSDTLANCRWDTYSEMVIVLLTLCLFVIFILVARKTEILTIAASVISSLISIMIFTTDVFSSEINNLFLMVPAGLILYGLFYVYKTYILKQKSEPDDMRL